MNTFCALAIAASLVSAPPVQTAKALLLESPRIWQSAHAAQPPRSAHDDEPVGRAQKWLVSHFRESADLDGLAAKVGMSPRNFARRFKAATGEAPLAGP